jgi:hypothetical protein
LALNFTIQTEQPNGQSIKLSKEMGKIEKKKREMKIFHLKCIT